VIAWCNDRFLPAEAIQISPRDRGFLQSATVVERFRTWGGRLPPLEPHLRRLARGCATLGITDVPEPPHWQRVLESLSGQNAWQRDVGLTLLVTPGPVGGQPTRIVLPEPLDLSRLRSLQTHGQPLVIADTQQPSPQCWPRDIKVRARLHYFLADRQATAHAPRALAVLRDTDGSITETSTSNVILVAPPVLRMPPADRVLPGVMVETLTTLMCREGWRLEREAIFPEQLRAAPEVWLTGSLGGLWAASAVDQCAKPLSDELRHWQSQLWQHLSHGN
jgi:branched-subunit amino acid aminotransferase/4-amino-4-deoxychorismate lyase